MCTRGRGAAGRRVGAVVVALTLAAVSGCSSAKTPTAPAFDAATVTGPARHYSFSGGVLARSRYPDPCTLLSRQSAQLLVGSPVTVDRSLTRCTWVPRAAVQPTLVIDLREIGSQAASQYASSVTATTRAAPRSRSARIGIGRQATLFRLSGGQAIQIDVVVGQVYFRVIAQSPQVKGFDIARKRAVAQRTAVLVARQFR